jgi:hypothetical protein
MRYIKLGFCGLVPRFLGWSRLGTSWCPCSLTVMPYAVICPFFSLLHTKCSATVMTTPLLLNLQISHKPSHWIYLSLPWCMTLFNMHVAILLLIFFRLSCASCFTNHQAQNFLILGHNLSNVSINLLLLLVCGVHQNDLLSKLSIF